jgi:hypothetical protein
VGHPIGFFIKAGIIKKAKDEFGIHSTGNAKVIGSPGPRIREET